MKQLLYMMCIGSAVFLAGCYKSPIAWRGVVHQTIQHASTEGYASAQPETGNIGLQADKAYSDALKADLGSPNEKKKEEEKK